MSIKSIRGGTVSPTGALGWSWRIKAAFLRHLPLLVLLCSLCSCNDRISKDRETRLKPVILYVDTYIKDHHRLPTEEEFRSATSSMDSMLVLHDRTHKYTASLGARTETDYMVGIWRADWYHYYKSWDHSFLNGSDEPL